MVFQLMRARLTTRLEDSQENMYKNGTGGLFLLSLPSEAKEIGVKTGLQYKWQMSLSKMKTKTFGECNEI